MRVKERERDGATGGYQQLTHLKAPNLLAEVPVGELRVLVRLEVDVPRVVEARILNVHHLRTVGTVENGLGADQTNVRLTSDISKPRSQDESRPWETDSRLSQ